MSVRLRKKCPHSELFLSLFFRIRTLYSVRMRENTDQNNSKYGYILRSIRLLNNPINRAILAKAFSFPLAFLHKSEI